MATRSPLLTGDARRPRARPEGRTVAAAAFRIRLTALGLGAALALAGVAGWQVGRFGAGPAVGPGAGPTRAYRPEPAPPPVGTEVAPAPGAGSGPALEAGPPALRGLRSGMLGRASCLALGIASDEGCADLDRMIAGLKRAPLAYNRPARMVRDRTVELVLALGTGGAFDPGAELAGLAGDVVGADAAVARLMSAELRGAGFDVAPGGPQVRTVSAAAPPRWRWFVTPLVAGDGRVLTLDLFAHLQVEGDVLPPVTVRTFRDRIDVDVGLWDQVQDGVAGFQPLHAFAVGVAGTAAGLLAWLRRRRGRTAAGDPA